MLHRRTLLAVPLAAALPAWAPAPSWKHEVSELRVAVSGDAATALARAMQARLGVAVVPVAGERHVLVAALDAGHIEAALLDAPTLALARRIMGARLLVQPGTVHGRTPVVRQVLPADMRAELRRALDA